MNNKYIESISVVLGVTLVFLVQNTIFSDYASYLLALLIIFFTIYISVKKRSKKASDLFSGGAVEIFCITSIIIFIVALTGGLSSPLFFFIYFLIFLLAFMCASTTIWVFVICIVFFFIPEASNNPSIQTFIKIFSVLLISPIAYFINKELERRQLLTRRIQEKTDDIIHDAQALKDDSSLKTPEETEVIDEIIEEASSLKNDSER